MLIFLNYIIIRVPYPARETIDPVRPSGRIHCLGILVCLGDGGGGGDKVVSEPMKRV